MAARAAHYTQQPRNSGVVAVYAAPQAVATRPGCVEICPLPKRHVMFLLVTPKVRKAEELPGLKRDQILVKQQRVSLVETLSSDLGLLPRFVCRSERCRVREYRRSARFDRNNEGGKLDKLPRARARRVANIRQVALERHAKALKPGAPDP